MLLFLYLKNNMLHTFFDRYKKYIPFLIPFGFLLVFIPLLFFIMSPQQQAPIPAPEKETPITVAPTIIEPPQTVSPLQKAIIGVTTNQELENLPAYIGKETNAAGETNYTYLSEITIRPNNVITDKNGVALFERILIPEDPEETGYATISEFKNKYGEPETVLKGSKFYSWVIETYFYGKLGMAVVGNPNTDEVYEIHRFLPMTVEKYMADFGEDLNQGSEAPEEGEALIEELLDTPIPAL